METAISIPDEVFRRAEDLARKLVTLDRGVRVERSGKLPAQKLELILDGIGVVLGR